MLNSFAFFVGRNFILIWYLGFTSVSEVLNYYAEMMVFFSCPVAEQATVADPRGPRRYAGPQGGPHQVHAVSAATTLFVYCLLLSHLCLQTKKNLLHTDTGGTSMIDTHSI
jgi:hypothetical protein